jgi:hypothetical protein
MIDQGSELIGSLEPDPDPHLANARFGSETKNRI